MSKAKEAKVIELGGVKYNGDWLRSVTQEKAVSSLRHKFDVNQIVNAHKQANGLSVRNHDEGADAQSDKPATKPRSRKAKK